MATAARYWRVYFRSNNTYDYGTLAFVTMKPYDAAGVDLSANVSAINANGQQMLSGYSTLTNMLDGDTTTVAVSQYNGFRTTTSWRSFTFDFGVNNAKLVDYFDVRISDAAYYNSVVAANSVDIAVDTSDDNVTWSRVSVVARPIYGFNAEYKVPATVSSVNAPAPPRITTGGSGGIYGIVSEDGVALPNRPVMLYERETFYKIAHTTTDENGGYGFNGLNEDLEYLVMSVDPSGPPYKNAIVWDRIKPINTKGALTPQSAFWARRLRTKALGPTFCVNEYLDGATYRYFGSGVAGNSECLFGNPSMWNGFGFDTESAVGGELLFLRSPRTATNIGTGLYLYGGAATFGGRNAAGSPENYSRLSFEMIVRMPEATETALIFVWGGTRDSDDAAMWGHDGYNGWYMRHAGPTVEIKPTGDINVRFPLSARNRATARCTYNATPGSIRHIMVTYEQDASITLYVDGVKRSSAVLTGTGRLWGHTMRDVNVESWDSAFTQYGNGKEAAIRRINALYISGYGRTAYDRVRDNSLWQIPPGWGGGVALAALYGTVFTDADVADLYDSFANWETHVVTSSMSGYAAEIEADNPKYYARLDALSVVDRPMSLCGMTDNTSWYEGSPTFGNTGFTAGATSIGTHGGAILLWRVDIQSTFTVEMFVRQTANSGTQRLWLSRIYDNNTPVCATLVGGVLEVSIYDNLGVTTTIPTGFKLALNTDYHIAVTYDPWDTKRAFVVVNGVVVTTASAPAQPYTSHEAQCWLCIGANASGTGPSISERFQGYVGEFAVYNYAVPVERLAAHYEARSV